MSLREYVQAFAADIDATIYRMVGDCEIDDDERELWVQNHEPLYSVAFEYGVTDL